MALRAHHLQVVQTVAAPNQTTLFVIHLAPLLANHDAAANAPATIAREYFPPALALVLAIEVHMPVTTDEGALVSKVADGTTPQRGLLIDFGCAWHLNFRLSFQFPPISGSKSGHECQI